MIFSGAHRRTGSTSVQQTFGVRKLFKHERFKMRHLQNDIALLQLQGSIQSSNKVNTVCLPSSVSRVSSGTQCYITGTTDYLFDSYLLVLRLIFYYSVVYAEKTLENKESPIYS